MIIKFDHITYVIDHAAYSETDNFLCKQGYKLAFDEKEKPNIPIKFNFLTHKQELHNLYYYEHKNKFPIEVISYSKITNFQSPFTIDIESELIQVHSNNLSFFEKIVKKEQKINENKRIVDISGILDKKPILLEQKELSDVVVSWRLDNCGYCCPTFLVTNITKMRKFFIKKGLKCTEINSIDIGGKELDILFIEGQNKELVEIIAYKNK